MATKLPPVDIILVGFGWTGGILAKELATTGLKILALERGGPRDTYPDFAAPGMHDELRYAQRHELMVDVSRDTLTFRNNPKQTALPMRQLGSFLPGTGVGGAGVHWNGVTWRWLPWDHEPLKRTVERYGKNAIPEGMQIQDWGVTYDELEPYYEKFEYVCGVSGKAGNLKGEKVAGGNVFEGARKRDYPNPPLIQTQAGMMFEKAAKEMGYHPFPHPASNASKPYVNPDGSAFGACHYCGFCERFGCEAQAKASPHMTVIPLALKHENVQLRTNARVLRVTMDSTGKRATGVTYLDARGQEFEQPADLILLTAYQLNNVHLMLLSGIGKPYDPASGQGVVGRNYSYQAGGGCTAFFDESVHMNQFMGAGALATGIGDFDGDSFDHGRQGFIGGGTISTSSSGARPIGYHPVPPGTPRWGSAWKQAVAKHYNHTLNVGSSGSNMSYRDNYLDLDPTYKDPFGRPLMRMTFDFKENEIKQTAFMAEQCAKIAQSMNPIAINKTARAAPYSIVPYQSTHNIGGAVMGTDPRTSAVNRYLQVWDVPNVFVVGASAFPQNASKNPTGPVGAMAYWTAEAIREKYLKSPGPLVSA